MENQVPQYVARAIEDVRGFLRSPRVAFVLLAISGFLLFSPGDRVEFYLAHEHVPAFFNPWLGLLYLILFITIALAVVLRVAHAIAAAYKRWATKHLTEGNLFRP